MEGCKYEGCGLRTFFVGHARPAPQHILGGPGREIFAQAPPNLTHQKHVLRNGTAIQNGVGCIELLRLQMDAPNATSADASAKLLPSAQYDASDNINISTFESNIKSLYDEQRDLVNQGHSRSFALLTVYLSLFVFCLNFIFTNGLVGRADCCSSSPFANLQQSAAFSFDCCALGKQVEVFTKLLSSDSGDPAVELSPTITQLPTCCHDPDGAHQFKGCILAPDRALNLSIICGTGGQESQVVFNLPIPEDSTIPDDFEQLVNILLIMYQGCLVDKTSAQLKGLGTVLFAFLVFMGATLTLFAIDQSLSGAVSKRKVVLFRAFMQGGTSKELEDNHFMKTDGGGWRLSKDLLLLLISSAPFYMVPILAFVIAFAIAGLIWSTNNSQFCGEIGTFFGSSWWMYLAIVTADVVGILIVYFVLGNWRLKYYKEEIRDIQCKLAKLAARDEPAVEEGVAQQIRPENESNVQVGELELLTGSSRS
ncbi:hypothetical protein KFL_002560140 [Klebsormidium nitens]|uniref:Uncharacterized protein n=1 Tax=Klebsormidium nitens TaxID=105231 RepID=A0A0U9I7N9_KLENI|nr:hypothetical protein KFL_002560140 [Klebsormidium nitens]|eukprot:GAQ85830.1 hypothetical protein KFL_002560140 [Klebsormidium nitens]